MVRDLAGGALELPKYALMGMAGPATPLVFAAEGALSDAHKGAAAAGKGAVGGLVYSAAPGLGVGMPAAVRVPFMASAGGGPAFLESAKPGVTPEQALLSSVPATALMGGLGLTGDHTVLSRDSWLHGNDGSLWDTSAAEKGVAGGDQTIGPYLGPELTSSESSSYPTYEEVV